MRLHAAAALMLREIGLTKLAEKFETNSLSRQDIAAMTFSECAALTGIMTAIGYDDGSLMAICLVLEQKANPWLDKLEATERPREVN